MRSFLVALLALDIAQVGVGLLAATTGCRRIGAARIATEVEARVFHHSHARFGLAHAGLLSAGSLVLGIPIVLGLTHAIGYHAAVYSAVALELVGFVVARAALGRFEREHLRRVARLE